MPDNIQNIDLKKRAKTFLGLDQKCLTCHDDYHQKTLTTIVKNVMILKLLNLLQNLITIKQILN